MSIKSNVFCNVSGDNVIAIVDLDDEKTLNLVQNVLVLII